MHNMNMIITYSFHYIDLWKCYRLSEADCSSSSDATAYTEAIWNYVLMLHGIQIEFYHHNEVNQRLSSELKAFIKLLACFPEKLHHPMFNRFSQNFKHFERVLNQVFFV